MTLFGDSVSPFQSVRKALPILCDIQIRNGQLCMKCLEGHEQSLGCCETCVSLYSKGAKMVENELP